MATKINSAVAVAPRTVRITFDSSSNVDGTALAPANWAFVPSGTGPFYTPSAVAIVGVDSATVPMIIDVTLDQEPSPGFLYAATCTSVTGITSDAIHNIGLFWALVPAAPSERDLSLIDLIPQCNIAEDASGDLARFVACLQEVVTLLWNDIDRWGAIFDIDKCPDNFVDLILEQLGSPVEVPDLTVIEKRKLCTVLVSIYKIKSSLTGIKAAIKFFTGLPAQVANFYGMGALLSDATHTTGTYLGTDGTDPGTCVLGSGDPWALTVKCATPGGVALTASQVTRVTEIVNKMRPSVARMVALAASYDAPPRLDIKDNGSHSLTITCAGVGGTSPPSSYETFWRPQPGVNEWNGSVQALTGSGPSSVTLTADPATDARYWAACASATVPGLLSNEVTNVLTTPALTATGQSRNIHLSWPAVSGATSYRIYKSTTAKTRPSAADNAATPIRVSSNTYDDVMETGTTFYYIVVPLVGDSEGFYSNEAHATSI